MWMLLAPAAVAQVAPAVDAADAPAVQEMIRDQIGAFQRDDAGSAWKHVAPGLKAKFGTADRFLEVVREGYRPVYRPEEYTFRELTRWDGEPAQWLDVTGPDGGTYRALYLLEKQADGTWRTAGCLLFVVERPDPPGV